MSTREDANAHPLPRTRTASAGVQSVERAFRLLELMAGAGRNASAAELTATSGIPRASVDNLLRTLVAGGYAHESGPHQYLLGARVARLGEAAARQVGAAAKPQLHQLAADLGETASLAVLSGDAIVYVMDAPAGRALRTATDPGRSAHPHASAVGKAILARMNQGEARGVAARSGMPSLTPSTIIKPDELLVELAKTKERGYALDDEEQEIGMRCYAVSVPALPHAAISISGPPERVDTRLAHRAIPLLRAAAARIADGLTSRGSSATRVLDS